MTATGAPAAGRARGAWMKSVAGWFALFLATGFLVVMVLLPAVVGGERYTILTGSMRPTYPPGTLIVVRPAEPRDLGVGTAITYQLESGQPAVVTHRIVSVRNSAAGRTSFLTQGDANRTVDPDPVVPEQIRGEVWYSLPWLGYVDNWLTGERRAVTVAALIVALVGYAGYSLVADVRERRARGRSGR